MSNTSQKFKRFFFHHRKYSKRIIAIFSGFDGIIDILCVLKHVFKNKNPVNVFNLFLKVRTLIILLRQLNCIDSSIFTPFEKKNYIAL